VQVDHLDPLTVESAALPGGQRQQRRPVTRALDQDDGLR
jgi:hypothetical protein